ncbi:hypothetical protein GCK32_002696 [Trichostrongylus colubriformis]|uniref:Phytoene synthase n=1 Tax=Trichostrongylus colubriformis TaxID=6319 RepID=A0AAN8FZX0_TRICO
MSNTLYNVITLVSLLSLLHCAYSAAQHRSYLRLTEQPFVSLPADVLAQTLISLVALIYGASHVAGAFQHIKSDPRSLSGGLLLPRQLSALANRFDTIRSLSSFSLYSSRTLYNSTALYSNVQPSRSDPDFSKLPGARKPKSKVVKPSRVLEITKEQAEEAFRSCLETLRLRDHDNYQAVFTMPKSCRPELVALLAFNVELAVVREKITPRSTDTAGMYRLQFWRDTIAAIYGDSVAPIPRQPVAIALCAFAPNASMSLLDSLIVARQKTIGDRPFPSVADLENYGVATTGALICLQADALARVFSLENLSESTVKAAHELGAAYGVMNLLRSFLPLLSKGVVLLPTDLMTIHNLKPDAVYNRKNPEGLVLLVKELVKVASDHMAKSRLMLPSIPRTLRKALTPASSVTNYILQNTKKLNYNLYDSRLQRRYPLLIWTMLIKNMLGRY